MKVLLLRLSVLLLILSAAVLLLLHRWASTPYGRLDYGAALTAKFLSAGALTRLGNTFIEIFPPSLNEQVSLLELENAVYPVLQQDIWVPAQWGRIPVRRYRSAIEGPLPAILWIHGGGWVSGQHYVSDEAVISLASQLQIAVFSVDYRIAPDHPFPAGLNDCYRVLQWLAENAVSLDIDPTRLIVRGESAGGNLAAAVTLMSREKDGPEIFFQVLHQPAVDLRSDPHWASYQKFGKGYFLEASGLDSSLSQYFTSPAQRMSEYASPILADLTGLPPALVTVAEFDPLHDEAVAYSKKLEKAGVKTQLYESKGALHSLLGSPGKEEERLDLELRELKLRLAHKRVNIPVH